MRHQEPTRRRAGGSILPHKPGNWQTADGQVHFPSGVSGLRYGRATPFRDGGGRDVVCSRVGVGWTPPSGRGSKHMASRGVPLPQSASLLSVVQSPPLLARLGLIVREAATARGLPHPGTAGGGRWARGSGGGRGLYDVGGRGSPTLASGEGRAGLPARRGHGGRCTRWGLERQARDTWARRQAPPPRPLSADRFLPASGSSRKVILSCRGRLDLIRSRDGA